MKQVVIMPGGFHPFHAGHYALYQQAQEAFPGADVYVAATNDTSSRPFPFALKEKLAKLAGVAPRKFIQVKSPFRAMEIVGNMDPATTQLIFVRSSKDADKPPQAGGIKKDGQPAYLQLLKGQEELAPMSNHAYMAYLPTVEFGPGMTSATEIRNAWPTLNEKRKTALVMSLYPKTQKNPALAATVVKMLDTAMGTEEVDEGEVVQFPKKHRGDISDMHECPKCGGDLQGGKYMGHQVQVCMPCKQVYLPPNSGIDQQGNKIQDESISRRGILKGLAGAGALGAAGKASAIAGAIPTPSHQQAMYKAMADSNAAQARADAAAKAKADAERLKKNTELVDKEQRVNHHKLNESGNEYILYINDKPAAKYTDIKQAEQDVMLVKSKVPTAKFEIKQEVCNMVAVPTGLREALLKEFAPDEGGGGRKFIPWPEFIEQLKQILHKDFDCKENIVKSTIKARFVPHDPMEYGPTMLYSYYETRAGGRNKGAVSTRGSIQIGKYFTGGLFGQEEKRLLTSFNLLKGHPFERHFDLTFDNIYKIANIIKGNTEGALEFKPEAMAEDAGPIEAYGYVYDRRDQRVLWRKVFPSAEAAHAWADSKNATILGTKPVQQTVDEDYVDEKY